MLFPFNPASKHEDYIKRLPQWTRQRDAVEGEDAIKAAGQTYLRKLGGQPVQSPSVASGNDLPLVSYEDYKDRATFMNATGRTRDGLVGAIMRKEPELDWPKSDEAFLLSAGRNQESFVEIRDEALSETIGIGRYGQLVDASSFSQNSDPYVASYFAETITDWEQEEVDGRIKPVRIHLRESATITNPEGERQSIERYRVLWLGLYPMPRNEEEDALYKADLTEWLKLSGTSLEELGGNPVYFQEVWEEIVTADDGRSGNSSQDKRFVRVQVSIPRAKGGALLRSIPFTFFNPTGTRTKPEKPTLLDLTVVNIAHYKNSADLEHGAHFTALPQPWISGFTFKGPLYLGSATAWVTETPGAQAGYLEFTGQGLGFLKELMAEKKKEMAALGARLLETQSPAGSAEAAETVKLRQSGETSVLAKLSIGVSQGLSGTMRWLAVFRGKLNEKDIPKSSLGIRLNLDFGVDPMSSDMINAIMGLVQAGHMSWNTAFWNFKRGELAPGTLTEEQEAIRIEAGTPGGMEPPVKKPTKVAEDLDDDLTEESPEE